MRNMLIILLLFLFWSCTSCNHDDSKTDLDAVSDSDSVVITDSETIDKDSEVVSDLESDLEIDEDNSGNPDAANDTESGEYDKPWLVDNDPYSDRDKFLYEYYGDYDVIPEDPEKVRENLWKYKFTAITEKVENMCAEGWIQPFEACAEN